MKRRPAGLVRIGIFCLLIAGASPGSAAEQPPSDLFDSGRLLATGGVATVEGAAGGGLSSWAVIAGYGTRNSVGMTVHGSYAPLSDFTLSNTGVAVGLFNRVEVSFARSWFDTRSAGGRLGLGSGFTFHQSVYGVKLRVAGDVVYDQDNWLPQLALGMQYKTTDDTNVLKAIGAASDHGVDYYAAATKLFLDRSLLVSGAVRATRANQFGILGYGGDAGSGYQPEFEGSLAVLLRRDLVVGGEYRTKPSNLRFTGEDDAKDLFAAYFFSKNASVTLAYLDLGTIATQRDQRGGYLSLQLGF